MTAIQYILIPLLVILVILYFRRLRTKLLDRMIVLLLGGAGIAMVLVPDLAQSLAKLFGVGRGADLVMYLGLVGLAFMNFVLFAKTRELENSVTEAVRVQAIKQAEPPKE